MIKRPPTADDDEDATFNFSRSPAGGVPPFADGQPSMTSNSALALYSSHDNESGSVYSIVAPDCCTTFAHIAISLSTKRLKAAGDASITTSLPSFLKPSRTGGNLSARTRPSYSVPITVSGVRAGANRPIQTSVSASGKPASRTVGTSGSSGDRAGDVIDRPRTATDWMCGNATTIGANIMSTRPVSTSVMACDVPR